jgi:hypothetical protein
VFKILTATVIAASICVLMVGCGGDGRLQTKGRVVMNGQPLIPKEGESVRVTFVPILPDGKPPRDHYHAVYDPANATFWSAGKDKKGMPPGKYRVAVEYKRNREDVFGGKFDENQSPFVYDVDSKTSELVINLDSPPK